MGRFKEPGRLIEQLATIYLALSITSASGVLYLLIYRYANGLLA